MIYVNISSAVMVGMFFRCGGVLPYAGHNWEFCKKGEPCIALFSCSEDMVLIVLEHEILHHALSLIGEFAASRGIDRLTFFHRIGEELDACIMASHALFGVDD